MKLIAYIFIALLLLFVIYEAVQLFGTENIKSLQLTNINSLINPTVISSSSPTSSVLILTPTITQPSERALKAAAIMYEEASELSQISMQKAMLATGAAVLTVKRLALILDNDQAKLIMTEVVIEKNHWGQSSTINTYTQPQTTIQSNTNTESALQKYQRESQQQSQQLCQEQINKYTLCMSEYTSKMSEYNTCVSDKLVGRTLMFCTQPNNFCGFKPSCAN